MSQCTFEDTQLERFASSTHSGALVSPRVDLSPTPNNDTAIVNPFGYVVGGSMELAGTTRPNIANSFRVVARHAHGPCERHWKTSVRILTSLRATSGSVCYFREESRERWISAGACGCG